MTDKAIQIQLDELNRQLKIFGKSTVEQFRQSGLDQIYPIKYSRWKGRFVKK